MIIYLDLRKLGYTPRVERVSVDVVRARLAELRQIKAEEKIRNSKPKVAAIEEFNSRVSILEQESIEQKAKRDADFAQKKAERQRAAEEAAKKLEEEAARAREEAGEEDVAALMGFGGFGSTKKR